PESGFSASLRPTTVVPTLAPSASTQIVVAVKNTSNSTWPCSSVHLGNHWLSESGASVVFDDARAELSQDLPPGGEELLTLTVTAPQQPAIYQLELDMVQEDVSWFKRRGSETAILIVNVEAEQRPDIEPPVKAFKARMEMYGTPLDEV